MDDTIYRQEAIRWVKTECNPYGKSTIDFESGKKVIEHLKDMPSAQQRLITCDGCKYVGTYDTDFPCSSCIRREKDYYAPEE